MVAKKATVILFSGIFVTAILAYLLIPAPIVKKDTDKPTSVQPIKKTSQEVAPKLVEKKYDLYSNKNYDLPLYSIVEISKLSPQIKKIVDDLFEKSMGFYFLRVVNNKVFIILQNPVNVGDTYHRHDLQFVEIDEDGRVFYHNAGFSGVEGEILNAVLSREDTWDFDESIEPYKPLKHIAYNEKGKIKFIETWNYDSDVEIKYQMKDGHKKIISLLKESQEDDLNYRKEHIFYDNDCKIRMSLAVNYEGANITRLTFYNAHESIDGVTIVAEYEGQNKSRELIYDDDYRLLYELLAKYDDENRIEIEIRNSEGKVLKKLRS